LRALTSIVQTGTIGIDEKFGKVRAVNEPHDTGSCFHRGLFGGSSFGVSASLSGLNILGMARPVPSQMPSILQHLKITSVRFLKPLALLNMSLSAVDRMGVLENCTDSGEAIYLFSEFSAAVKQIKRGGL
jgi:hypothetical protein